MDGRRCVGIDVSADEVVVAIAGKAERLTLANDIEGHARLVKLLTRGKSGARVCLEATGIYHLDLALALHRTPGIEVSVLNPASVRDFGRALMERSKTDRVDAGVLLAYAERMPFSAWQPPAPEILDLRAIVRRMGALTVTRTQERNRLHAAGHCAELTEAIAWDIEAHLEHLAQSLERLSEQAVAIVNAQPELARRFARLISVRGIATTSALAILAELAVLPPDMTARQWVAHAGLDPRHMESGTSLRKPTRISKAGNRHLRAALYMPAMVSTRHEPNIRGFYQRRIANGLKPIQALVAVERKLLHAIHGMWSSDTDFDGSKFFVMSA
ncbi:MAG: IS110 family transposase [Myxococcales bacterium]|nr:IS110 family transposase [Myxococcales bacterium]